jgi:hypothetical protein
MRIIQGSQKKGDGWWDDFQNLLDEQNDWPASYTFKFIAPLERVEAVKALFAEGQQLKTRASSKGNYVSVTAQVEMDSSDEVVAVYDEASDIDGVIAL